MKIKSNMVCVWGIFLQSTGELLETTENCVQANIKSSALPKGYSFIDKITIH